MDSRENESRESQLQMTADECILDCMSRKRTDNRREWEKENMRSATIRYNVKTEPEFTEWMNAHKPNQPYIKGLIRKDMEKSKD